MFCHGQLDPTGGDFTALHRPVGGPVCVVKPPAVGLSTSRATAGPGETFSRGPLDRKFLIFLFKMAHSGVPYIFERRQGQPKTAHNFLMCLKRPHRYPQVI